MKDGQLSGGRLEMTMPLALRLRKVRKQRKYTQLRMARFLEIKRDTYAQYELGLRDPSIERLVDMAARLGVSVDYLLGVSNFELPMEPARQQGILKKLRRVRLDDYKPYRPLLENPPMVADRDPDSQPGDYPLN